MEKISITRERQNSGGFLIVVDSALPADQAASVLMQAALGLYRCVACDMAVRADGYTMPAGPCGLIRREIAALQVAVNKLEGGV